MHGGRVYAAWVFAACTLNLSIYIAVTSSYALTRYSYTERRKKSSFQTNSSPSPGAVSYPCTTTSASRYWLSTSASKPPCVVSTSYCVLSLRVPTKRENASLEGRGNTTAQYGRKANYFGIKQIKQTTLYHTSCTFARIKLRGGV